jgi:transposase, IS5 family
MATDDFFRARLDSMIDMRHPLAVLATRMPWEQIEAALAPAFAHKDRAGRVVEGCDLFGPTAAVVGGGISARGRRRLPIRLMVALLYLKHAFNLSDEELVARWSENVYWQFFSGMHHYEPRLPCDHTQLGRFRRALGEAGVEQLLKSTIEAAVDMRVVKPAEFERVIVDTTVQEKAIAHPVDSRLLEIARHKVARAAKRCAIVLKQTFAKEGKTLRRKARRLRSCQAVPPPAQDRQAPAHDPGCAHARCAARAESNFAGRCTRVGSRPGTPSIGVDAAANVARPRRTHPRPAASRQEQAVRASRTGGRMHLQGKARKPYEFGVKVSLTITHQHGLMVGARSFPSNPYDGHTLAAQLEQRWPSPPVAQSQTAAQFIRVWLMVTPV